MVCLIAKRRGFFGSLLLAHIQRSETNQTSLAERLEKNESTLRSWINDNRSPDLDAVIDLADKLPDDVLFALLTKLGAKRFLPVPVDAMTCTGERLEAVLMDANFHTAKLLQDADDHLSDEFLSHDEAGDLIEQSRVASSFHATFRAMVTAFAGKTLRTVGRRA